MKRARPPFTLINSLFLYTFFTFLKINLPCINKNKNLSFWRKTSSLPWRLSWMIRNKISFTIIHNFAWKIQWPAPFSHDDWPPPNLFTSIITILITILILLQLPPRNHLHHRMSLFPDITIYLRKKPFLTWMWNYTFLISLSLWFSCFVMRSTQESYKRKYTKHCYKSNEVGDWDIW